MATAAAAAAVTIAGVFVVVTGLREGAGDAGAPAAERALPQAGQEDAAGVEAEAEAPSALEASREGRAGPLFTASDRDYDPDTLAKLGGRLKDQATASIPSGFPQPATAFYDEFRVSDFPPAARAAARCILEELPPRDLAVPFLIQEAWFQGDPVYVAAFLQGPGADEPYDRLLLWVLEREGCALRYFATIRL